MNNDDKLIKLSKEQVKDLKEIQERLQELAELLQSYLRRMEPPESVEAYSFVKTELMAYYEHMFIGVVYSISFSKNLVTFFEECPTGILKLIFHPKENRSAQRFIF